MEAGLDNANNPFASPNGSLKGLGAEADINLQKNNDGLLLNLSESFKANGKSMIILINTVTDLIVLF